MDVETWTQVSNEACDKIWQTSPLCEACSICAFKLDETLATMSMWQTPSAVHYTAAPCHVLVANVQMVVPLLARQSPDPSTLGTLAHNYLTNALVMCSPLEKTWRIATTIAIAMQQAQIVKQVDM